MSWTQPVLLVMRREMRARLFSKAFLIGQVSTAAILIGVFALSSLVGGDEPTRLGLLGSQPDGAVASLEALAAVTDTELEITDVADRGAAEAAVQSGEVDAVVIDGTTLLFDQQDDWIVGLVTPSWQQASAIDSLIDDGLTPDQATAALAAPPLTIEELSADPDSDARQAVAFITTILMFLAIQVAGAYIMFGVFEEKSTKVVELVLSSMRARYLLAGKVLGIGVLGLVQVAVLASSALLGAWLFSSSALPTLSTGLIGISVLWFLVGYLLYGTLFAAGASLAPRQEDAQATLAPISIILALSYFAAIFAGSEPDGLVARIVSWIPFTAPFAMPARIAAGESPAWEVAASLVVASATAAAMILLAERIYVRSIIHTDRKLGWREAWRLGD